VKKAFRKKVRGQIDAEDSLSGEAASFAIRKA